MVDPRQRMRALMRRVRQGQPLPTSEQMVRETFERLNYIESEVTPEEVLVHFNEYLRNLWEQTLVTLETYEEQSYARGIPHEFVNEFPEEFDRAEQVASRQGFREGVKVLFDDLYPMFRRAFLSVQQGRMARGGKDFELQIERLLTLAGVPFHKQESVNHTDLILPSLETHNLNRTISAVVSVKRTLRERWAEVAEELFNLRATNVFLFTADENPTNTHAERLADYNIHLVVWDDVKTQKFPERPLVLGYTEWANRGLGMLSQHWQ